MPAKVLHRCEIILVPFPFTDQSGTKVRPAIIVSADPQKPDIIIAFISSVIPSGKVDKTDLLLLPTDPSFAQTGLLHPSIFKMTKLMTIDRTLIMRRLGKAPRDLQAALDKRLKIVLGLTSQ